MIQAPKAVVTSCAGTVGNMSGVGQRCRLGCGERAAGCSTVLPRRLGNPRQMLSQALRNGPGRRSAPSPFSLSPASIGGFGGVGKVDSSPQFKKVGRGKTPAIPEIVWRAKVSGQVAAGKLVLRV